MSESKYRSIFGFIVCHNQAHHFATTSSPSLISIFPVENADSKMLFFEADLHSRVHHKAISFHPMQLLIAVIV